MSAAENEVRQGITEGRLFGIFSDPNFAAFTSLILICLLAYTLYHTKKLIIQVYCILNIFINTCYLIMSNSRTIYIAAVGTAFFTVFLITCENRKTENTSSRAFFMTLCKRLALTCAAIIGVYSIIFFPMQKAGQFFEPERQINDMVREDVTSDNITNNRSTIWGHYFKLYLDKPVFGFSLNSALPYAEEHYAGGYLDQTQYVTHNGYLSLLVETGITGFAVMAAFFIMTFIRTVQKMRSNVKSHSCEQLLIILTVSTLIFLMCFHDVFFTVNIETMLLFLAIGIINTEETRG